MSVDEEKLLSVSIGRARLVQVHLHLLRISHLLTFADPPRAVHTSPFSAPNFALVLRTILIRSRPYIVHICDFSSKREGLSHNRPGHCAELPFSSVLLRFYRYYAVPASLRLQILITVKGAFTAVASPHYTYVYPSQYRQPASQDLYLADAWLLQTYVGDEIGSSDS